MPRLKRVDCSGPGILRRRRGRGFEYVDACGTRIEDPETLARIRNLVIPPAWREVWISPHPNGHIQAIGIDAAGRKQYLYHERWRKRRDSEKFEHMLELGAVLPKMRAICRDHLALEGLTRERVLACAVRLLDRGFFRMGSEGYAEENETYGLATMQKRHVSLRDNVITFDYVAKGGKRRIDSVVDPDVAEVVAQLKRRRGGGPELLAYRTSDGWIDVKSTDINVYVKEISGADFTAKDFRTWSATVLAAVALAVSGQAATSRTARKRAISRAIQEVAGYLGNTPAVCRASYIDPRVFDRYLSGWTISGAFESLADVDELGEPATQGAVEAAVLDLLTDNTRSEAIENTDALAEIA